MATLGQLVVELVANTAKFQTDMRQVSQSMEDVKQKVSSTNQSINIFAGISLARLVEQVAQFTIEAVKMAAAAEQANFAFQSMARAANVSGQALSAAMVKAS